MIIKKCKNCNKEFSARQSSKQHCSSNCFSEYRSRPDILEKTLLRRAEFNLKKYGVDNPAKNLLIKEKTKQTCIKLYGVTSPTLNDNIHQKQIQTNIKKYGVKNPQQNKEIQKRQIETLFKNYGVSVPLKNKDILINLKKTNIERYGEDNSSKTKRIKEKTKQTCIKKYGSISPSQNEGVKNKQIKSRLKHHYNILINNIQFTNLIPLFKETEYIGNISYDTKYPFQCKICNSKFSDTLLNGNIPRCFICYPIKRTQSENEVLEFIQTLFPDKTIISGDRKILIGKELDIYIPPLKLAIEYNGLYWHSEIGGKKYKNYHLNKTRECENKEIRLIHIFEDEWIYNKSLIKNKILHILNKNISEKIYARKCEIRCINSDICNDFLKKNHIQGSDNSSIRLGAYFSDELISVMTFGALRNALGSIPKQNYYELYRFCTIINKRVVGIGSKMINYFIKKYNPENIISYADARWSTNTGNNLYKSMKFSFIKLTRPNYWYIQKNYNKRIHRFNFRKSELSKKLSIFKPELTEWENMQLNGYDRIWDCGNLKYGWNKQ